MNSNNQSERQSGCMTNHIEELMKAAGVKQYKRTYFECKGGRSTICLCPQIGVPNAWCKEDCNGEEMREKVEYFTPAFTPAKQLELIKLIVDIKEVECFYIQANKNGYKISCLIETTNFPAAVIATDPVMDIALAKLLIKLLKKCELNKSKVKRILKDV